jgi:hypothetical protein
MQQGRKKTQNNRVPFPQYLNHGRENQTIPLFSDPMQKILCVVFFFLESPAEKVIRRLEKEGKGPECCLFRHDGGRRVGRRESIRFGNTGLAHVLVKKQRLAYMLDLGNCTTQVEGF